MKHMLNIFLRNKLVNTCLWTESVYLESMFEIVFQRIFEK